MASKILVVEDDLNLLSTLKYNLVKERYDVITAVDGADDYTTKPFSNQILTRS